MTSLPILCTCQSRCVGLSGLCGAGICCLLDAPACGALRPLWCWCLLLAGRPSLWSSQASVVLVSVACWTSPACGALRPLWCWCLLLAGRASLWGSQASVVLVSVACFTSQPVGLSGLCVLVLVLVFVGSWTSQPVGLSGLCGAGVCCLLDVPACGALRPLPHSPLWCWWLLLAGRPSNMPQCVLRRDFFRQFHVLSF